MLGNVRASVYPSVFWVVYGLQQWLSITVLLDTLVDYGYWLLRGENYLFCDVILSDTCPSVPCTGHY